MNSPLIILDPGHGGKDTGAKANDIVERDWVREFCDEFYFHLSCALTDCDIVYMDDPDGMTLAERGRETAYYKNFFKPEQCLVLSVHVNAGPANLRGLMTFTHPDQPEMHDVGSLITRAAPPAFYVSGRRNFASDAAKGEWLQRPLNVLHPHTQHAHSILVECYYLTRVEEAEAAELSDTKKQLCASLTLGVAYWKAKFCGSAR